MRGTSVTARPLVGMMLATAIASLGVADEQQAQETYAHPATVRWLTWWCRQQGMPINWVSAFTAERAPSGSCRCQSR
jgi:hypothetical protein